MSLHNKPLTEVEHLGLLLHSLGSEVGKPSMLADTFRMGVTWALMSKEEQLQHAKRSQEAYLPVGLELQRQLKDLIQKYEQKHPS